MHTSKIYGRKYARDVKHMDKNKIKSKYGQKKKLISMSIRIDEDISKWLKENEYSPTKIFYEALKDLKCPHVKD